MAGNIFDFENEDRPESPERLNEYIRIASPGVWAVTAALVIVLAAFIFWAFNGKIVKHSVFRGVVDESKNYDIVVVIDASQYTGKNLVGREAGFLLSNGKRGKGVVVSSSEEPLSKDDLGNLLNDTYLTSRLDTYEYSYVLNLKPEGDLSLYSEEIADVILISEEISPVSFLLRKGGAAI